MQRQSVTSSNILEVGYDEPSQTLEVLFKGGHVYQYFDVPKAIFDELVGASSPGGYLNSEIKPNYRYARL
jgi:hypothetical protein